MILINGLSISSIYRDFIPNYARKAAPLIDLIKKGQPNKVPSEQPQENDYMTIKRELTGEPILILPGFNQSIRFEN